MRHHQGLWLQIISRQAHCLHLRCQTSFSVAKVGQRHTFSRFGSGIYTTGTSSKANDYVQEEGGSSHRAMLLCEVVVGNGASMTANSTMLTKVSAAAI